MDDEEGEKHPELGAKIVQALFGKEWGDFCKYHSRFYAQKDGQPVSRLCFADKLVTWFEPWWLYNFRCSLTGEMDQFMNSHHMEIPDRSSPEAWYQNLRTFLHEWVMKHAYESRVYYRNTR